MLSWVNGLKSISQHRNTCALSVYRSTVCHAINSSGQTAGDRHTTCCKLFTKQSPPAFAIPGVLSAADNGHLERAKTCGISCDKKHPSDKVRTLFAVSGITLPTREMWEQLREDVMRYGIYNQNLQAVPPTGSISYINHATSSIHPIVSKVEIRKEGKTGRVYYPAPFMTNENLALYQDAYEIGPQKIIDTYAEATRHVDQGLSLTLFFPDTATTRDINKAQIYAWRKGIKSLYYIRLRQLALEGTEIEGCVSCAL